MLRHLIILVAVLVHVAFTGCVSRKPTDRVNQDNTLQTVRPKSGGEMILLPGGKFHMGDRHGSSDEMPHEVFVDSFFIDKHTVSQKFFEKVSHTNPSKRKGATLPVERIMWTQAAQFCNTCSELEGLTPCYDINTWDCDFEANGYRLPTEAEWEYACRAGSQTTYCFGNDPAKLRKNAWCKPHSLGKTWPVGEKLPNRWGLYDMHGNVWQWCNDYYGETYYSESPQDNPRGPATGKKRVLRGGAWNSTAESCRAAYRFSEFQMFTDACFGSDSYGFRRVRNGQLSSGEKPKPSGKTVAGAIDNKPITAGPSEPPTTTASTITSPGTIDPHQLTGTIVFVSDRGGPLDLWKMKANGQGLTQLTHDDHADADPRFSPPGERIMYTTLRKGFPQIWMINADGSQPSYVTDGSQAAWSPDGNSVIFIRDDQAHIREIASGKEHRVTPETWRRCGVPAWRSDGKQVAVASRHLEQIGIFLLDVDGTQPTQLKTEDACCTPQWSPDNKKIIFQTDKGHIHLFYTDDAVEEQVTFGADIQHDARFSHNGSMFVYCRAPTPEGPWQLWITDLESDDLDSIQITKQGSNRLPDWHPQ